MDLEKLIETHRRMDSSCFLPGQLDEVPKGIIDPPHAVNSPLILADVAEPQPPNPTSMVSLQPVIPEESPGPESNGMLSKMAILALPEPKQNKHWVLNLRNDEIEDTAVERFVHGTAYQVLSVLLIVSNAIFIGVQTQTVATTAAELAQRDPPEHAPEQTGFLVVSNIFNVIFAIELFAHWYVDGVFGFFVSEERYWNILDIIIVTTGLIDFVNDMIYVASSERPDTGSSSVMRVLRVCRIVRLIRFIRIMRFFRELRMMIYSLLGSLKSLLWVTLVLGTMLYLFGISFTEATVRYLENPEDWLNPENQQLIKLFGSLDRSAISLFMSMSGGDDWGPMYRELERLPAFNTVLFLGFIIMAVFAVVNIVTGVFVDTAMQANLRDKEVVVHEEMEDKKETLKDLKQCFVELDTDSSGRITKAELISHMRAEEVIAYFKSMNLRTNDASLLFDLLDYDENGSVTIDEFILGCHKLQGEATTLDQKILGIEVGHLKVAISSVVKDAAEIKRSLAAQKAAWT